MAREIVQHAVIVVVQPQVVRYTCDRCGAVCGTRENRKTTWYGCGGDASEYHYCEKTCRPSDHPGWVKGHVMGCPSCYARARRRGETWMDKVTMRVLAGEENPYR